MRRIAWIVCVAVLLACLPLAAQQQVPRSDMLREAEWRQAYDEYEPDAALLDLLQQKLAGVRIEVYFAFWCSDSRHHVPPFLRIVDTLGPAAPEIACIEVARKAGPQQTYYAAEARVERVPTFVVYRAGREIGRIVENPAKSLLEDLLQILF